MDYLFYLKNPLKKFNVNGSTLTIGDLVNGRLDIPAYKAHDTWIVSLTSPQVKKQGESRNNNIW